MRQSPDPRPIGVGDDLESREMAEPRRPPQAIGRTADGPPPAQADPRPPPASDGCSSACTVPPRSPPPRRPSWPRSGSGTPRSSHARRAAAGAASAGDRRGATPQTPIAVACRSAPDRAPRSASPIRSGRCSHAPASGDITAHTPRLLPTARRAARDSRCGTRGTPPRGDRGARRTRVDGRLENATRAPAGKAQGAVGAVNAPTVASTGSLPRWFARTERDSLMILA